jgi:hypothetical protein
MTNWTGWKPVGDGQTEAAPAAVTFKDKLYVFVKARGSSDKKIYMTSSADGDTWAGWTEVPAKAGVQTGRTDGSPAATVLGGKLYLFINGVPPNDKTSYVSSTDDGATWTDWSQVSNPNETNLSPAAAALKDKLCVFVKGPDNKVYCAKGT